MNKRFVTNALIFSMFGGIILATTSCNNEPTEPTDIDPVLNRQYLTVDSSKAKVNYYVGDLVDKTNLVVKLVTVKDGKKDDGVITNDYHLSIKDDKKLTLQDEEIVVISNQKNVKSCAYGIKVTAKPIAADAIFNAVSKLKTEQNYTVSTTIGTNLITGVVANNGLIWSSTEQDYYYDEGLGYGYDEKEGYTFSFNYYDGKISNATYLVDQRGVDNGLFDEETLDQFEYRISNFSANNMTEEELNFIKNSKIDEQNRIKITPEYSKWIFNTIGHKLGTHNPSIAFKDGVAYLSLNEKGDLVIETIPSIYSNLAGMGSVSVVSNVGTTTIPELDEFYKNPVYTPSLFDRNLVKLEDLFRAQNYTITSTIPGVSGVFTDEYSVVKGALRDKKKPSSISIKEPNTIGAEAGLYRFDENEFGGYDVHHGPSDFFSYKSTLYLDTFPLFLDMNDRFVKNEEGIYEFKVSVNQSDPDDPTSELEQGGFELMYYDFATAFCGAIAEVWENDEIVVKPTWYDKFTLDIKRENGAISSVDISVYGDNHDSKGNRLLGTATVSNFGTSKDANLEKWMTDFLYNVPNKEAK